MARMRGEIEKDMFFILDQMKMIKEMQVKCQALCLASHG